MKKIVQAIRHKLFKNLVYAETVVRVTCRSAYILKRLKSLKNTSIGRKSGIIFNFKKNRTSVRAHFKNSKF